MQENYLHADILADFEQAGKAAYCLAEFVRHLANAAHAFASLEKPSVFINDLPEARLRTSQLATLTLPENL